MVSINDLRSHSTDGSTARRPTSPDGFLIVDKPAGMTSHDVVARLRRLCGTRRVGHGGTLDPMATGVLVCAVGRATRLLTYVTGSEKAYDATIRLGIGTATDDAEGEVVATPGCEHLAPTGISVAIASLTGDIMQVPTAVSAIKVDGKRAHALARAGEQVDLKARPVTVSQFVVHDVRSSTVELTGPLGWNRPATVPVVDLDVSVVVSSGTYVRALARDLGVLLGTAGHLTMLRRTRVGGYDLSAAATLEQLEAAADEANANGAALPTVPMAEAIKQYLPARLVSAEEAVALGHGRYIAASADNGVHAALDETGQLVALVENVSQQGRNMAKPVVVLV